MKSLIILILIWLLTPVVVIKDKVEKSHQYCKYALNSVFKLFYIRSINWRCSKSPIWVPSSKIRETIRLVDNFGDYPDKVSNKRDFVNSLENKFCNST